MIVRQEDLDTNQIKANLRRMAELAREWRDIHGKRGAPLLRRAIQVEWDRLLDDCFVLAIGEGPADIEP